MRVKRLELIVLRVSLKSLSIVLLRNHQVTEALVSLCGCAVLTAPFFTELDFLSTRYYIFHQSLGFMVDEEIN